MQKHVLNDYIKRHKKSNQRRRHFISIILILSFLVGSGVYWQLHLTGLSEVGQAYCNYEEHQHSEECINKTLVCSEDENSVHIHSAEAGCFELRSVQNCGMEEHAHDENCFETQDILTCGEDHEHSAQCFEEQTVLICPEEEHFHSEACFAEDYALICTLEENKGHVHTDECYETDYICGFDKSYSHIHTLQCYSDPEADLETPAAWTASIAAAGLNGNWPEDLVAVAETQLGYRESIKNYRVQPDGISYNGYTRYGDWYGDAYGDWDAMFVSFCLYYANIPSARIPYDSDSASWAHKLMDYGCYESSMTHQPRQGDIIFFDMNSDGSTDHVGIVTDSDDDRLTTIEGDSEKSVAMQHYSIGDTRIVGYGTTEEVFCAYASLQDIQAGSEETLKETAEEADVYPEDEQVAYLPSDSDQPIDSMIIEPDPNENVQLPIDDNAVSDPVESDPFGSGSIEPVEITGLETDTPSPLPLGIYSLNMGLLDYLHDVGGTFILILTNTDNTPIEQDENGNYIVTAQDEYKLTIRVGAPNGIAEGTYTYSLPEGVIPVAGSGSFVSNGVTLGTWTVDNDGTVTFVFNDNANSYTNISITMTTNLSFSEDYEEIEFDGNITVIIRRPEEGSGFSLEKWASGTIEEDSNGNQFIRWNVTVTSENDKSIVGETLTDVIQTRTASNHTYNATARGKGVEITAKDPDGHYYTWTLYGNSDGLTWSSDGKSWSYVMPDTVVTDNGATIYPDAGWNYELRYYTAIVDTHASGIVPYANDITVGEVTVSGYKSQYIGDAVGAVEKTGYLSSDVFHWEIDAHIHGASGDRYSAWNFWDYMKILDGNDNRLPDDIVDGIYYIGRDTESGKGDFNFNVPENLTLTIIKDGVEYSVPRFSYSAPPDSSHEPYAYNLSPDSRGYGWNLYLLMPCECTPETCQDWSNSRNICKNISGYSYTGGWCECWRETEPMDIVIEYDTPAMEAMEHYGGVGNKVRNNVEFYKNGDLTDDSSGEITVPGVFKKVISEDASNENQYIASYTITVNEAKLNLSGQDTLLIEDTMTSTLVYIPGTMNITAEGADGVSRVLEYGTDYDLVYHPESHVIDITVYDPGAEMYTLNYDTRIVPLENGAGGAVSYSNSASVTLFGKVVETESEEKIAADIVFSAETFSVSLIKTDTCSPPNHLPNAEFGLYSADGEPIASGSTGNSGTELGQLVFATDVANGIIFRKNTAYYIQEQTPPVGYVIDTTKHWFYFADSRDQNLETQHPGILWIQSQNNVYAGSMTVLNQPYAPELPATGGIGILPFIIGGSLLIAVPLLYEYISMRKCRERRSH